MQVMIALLKREWQEHLFGFGWAPVAVLGVLIFIVALTLMAAAFGTTTISYSSETGEGEHRSSERVEITDSLFSMSRFIGYQNWTDRQMDANLTGLRLAVARPFHFIYVLVIVFVLLGALHEDRRDRSVLFWKSMPVTDTETVLSKLIAAVWVAPVAVIAAIFTAQVLLLGLISVLLWSEGIGDAGRLWWHSGVLLGAVELVVGYLIQGLWALPLYAWLLAVSAAVPRVPFVWAIALPLVPIAIERVVFGTDLISGFVRSHAEFAALPRAFGNTVSGLSDQIALLATGQMWLGLAIGAGLLWAAVHFRARNNDL